MKTVTILDKKYNVIKDVKEALDIETLSEKLTDYFDNFDYIVGDWAYGKLRLKGFNKKENPHYKKINDYENLDEYIKNYCAYDCKYFVIEQIKD